eukprot:COSAG04_NODE_403_length_14894_cov_26.107198_11_plen_58_part_00
MDFIFEWRVELTVVHWMRNFAVGRREAGADTSPGALRAAGAENAATAALLSHYLAKL